MAKPVIMPKQGQSVESCIITEWYKQKGDKISPGDVLFSYETDKASFEEEASEEGTLLEIFFNDGDEVPVLTTVCVIGEEGEDISEYVPSSISDDTTPESSPEPSPEEVQKHTEDLPEGSETKKENASDGEKSLKISPRAKILAKEKGVSTKEISGSGPGGRIIVRDVAAVLDNRSPMTEVAKEKSLNEETSVPESGSGLGGMVTSNDVSSVNPLYDNDFEEKPLTNMRKLIANAMYASLQNSAQLTHHLGADARNVLALRKEVKKKIEAGEEDTNITINDMICYATIKALKKFPRVNAQLHDYN
ncbi:MAG: 2-oxo acid dehydrogenase subunit E2, partial [Marinilabilia sp.]